MFAHDSYHFHKKDAKHPVSNTWLKIFLSMKGKINNTQSYFQHEKKQKQKENKKKDKLTNQPTKNKKTKTKKKG